MPLLIILFSVFSNICRPTISLYSPVVLSFTHLQIIAQFFLVVGVIFA
jgi:hypothetical protein